VVDIELYQNSYFLTDEPVPYRLSCGVAINIYPIMVKESLIYNSCIDILQHNKNQSGDINIIKMSYLEYLINCITNNQIHPYKLITLLKMCLNIEDLSIEYKDDKIVLGLVEITKDDNGKDKRVVYAWITSKEFDEIKKIILYQNQHDYEDIEVSKDIQKIMEDYYKITSNGNIKVTLEEKMAFLGTQAGLTKKQILDMTYREFNMRFDLAIDQLEYQINKMAEAGGAQFKEKIQHFIFKQKVDKLKQFFGDGDKFKETIEGKK